MTSIQFGTEGWRSIMAEGFTSQNVRLVTQAIADHMRHQARGGLQTRSPLTIAVGYDTRFLSDRFARSVCEVLAANNIRCILSNGAIPTCAVSRYVVDRRLFAGIMVTASHNPPIYNGIKIKESFGGSATTQTVASVERLLGRHPVKNVPFEEALRDRRISHDDFIAPFLQGIRSFVDLSAIRRCRLHVIVDSMYGTGGRLIERLLRGGKCHVETLHADPDPLFGGQAPEPIASHLVELRKTVRHRHASVGIANDGDADRLGIIAPDGAWLNPGQALCVLLDHWVRTRHVQGAVVKTVSNTMMINRMTKALGLRLIEVPVGFKHIAKLMMEDKVLMGGEESGGIGITDYLPERDGIVNGLLLLEVLAMRRKSLLEILRELERAYGRWAYGRFDLHLQPSQVERLFKRLQSHPPEKLGIIPVAQINTLDGIKLIGRDESWLLFRRSGTEPIVRIYAETPSPRTLPALLGSGITLATRS